MIYLVWKSQRFWKTETKLKLEIENCMLTQFFLKWCSVLNVNHSITTALKQNNIKPIMNLVLLLLS